ncbi:ribosome biogenesis protein NOP53 [Zootermopsis nevadensis]|uniref:Ribosome biogenesis protein NOP53 n=1 Tax=Zootermopsis nevadensis TaxID=136037 RepID=A0A067R2S4_ZOONE|nr:ribosome biogenesis protein NOP53 [Zootermopsis nevadensis]KDR17226.1 hypothetical protein L798_08953 [Zootermopsis nevadensis]
MVSRQESIGVGRIKKRVSKKNKKSWRKYTDIKDVDSFLDEKRLEERLGTPFADRQDHELFQIDKEADEGQKADLVVRLKKPQKPIKCFAILEERSAVPDPIKKRNRVRTPEERKHPLAKKIKADRKEQGILKKKEVIALRNRALAKAKKNNKPKKGEFNADLWEDTDNGNTVDLDVEWLTPTTKYHMLKHTGKLKKKMPDKFLTKPYEIPAVESPHPGMSYNPSYGDHQNLLQEVANKELILIKEEKHLKRVTSKMFSRVTEDEKESMRMKEMSEGLPEAGEDKLKQNLDEGSETDSDYRAINPPAKNIKKTLKKRRNMKEAKKEQIQHKESRSEKKKNSDIYRLKLLNQELEAKDKKLAKLREKRERVKAIKEKEPKQLSKRKFEPLDLEFNLGEDLKGNLRSVKPEGNILEDRYKSFQRRNIIEPTIKQRTRRAKVKRYERKSHKMGWETKGY